VNLIDVQVAQLLKQEAMKTSSNIKAVQGNNVMKPGRHCKRNKTVWTTKTETYRSCDDAQKRAQQLQDAKVNRIIIRQKRIEVYYVQYQTAR